MNDTIPPEVARVLDLPTDAIVEATGAHPGTVAMWRKGRHPAQFMAAKLCTLAPPEDHAAIVAWCPPSSVPGVADPMETYAIRLPTSTIARLRATGKPSEVAREGIEQRLDTQHHAADCRRNAGAVDGDCPKCMAGVPL